MPLITLLTLMAGAVADTAVVCPLEYRAALAPWVTLREAEGHAITFLPGTGDVVAVRESVRRVAARQTLRYVLLVGDADGLPAGAMFGAPAHRRAAVATGPRIPSRYVPAHVNVRFGSEPQIATDNWLADLDDDGVPDLAVGRLTADSPEDVTTMVAKILAYETNRDFGLWRREVHFVAGVGGFGPLIDTAVESAAKSVIAAGLPPAYHSVMTQASWTSPYFPDPRAFRQTALAGLQDGCLFWVYLGHGQRSALDLAPVYSGHSAPILDADAARRMQVASGPAIACLFACYCGAFDGADDCLGEELLKARGGPVAVLCASRVTMPYGMTVLGSELLTQSLVEHRQTLGDAVLAAKRATADPAAKSSLRKSLDTMAALLSPAPVDLPGERAEHVAMFNLLGDPLLSLKHPQPVALRAPERASAGADIEIHGVSPIAGVGVVEVVVRRDRLRFVVAQRTAAPASAAEASRCADSYRAANDPCWARQTIKFAAGEFSTTLRLPPEAEGPCHVRVFVSGVADSASGAAYLEVIQPPAQDAAARPGTSVR